MSGPPQFALFIFAGGLAAAANYGSRFIFSEFVSFELAVTFAFMVGLGTGFILMRRYVFSSSSKPLAVQIRWYLIVNFLALVQTLAVSIFLVWMLPKMGLVGQVEAVAHFFGVTTPLVTSYLGHKHLSFGATPRGAGLDLKN